MYFIKVLEIYKGKDVSDTLILYSDLHSNCHVELYTGTENIFYLSYKNYSHDLRGIKLDYGISECTRIRNKQSTVLNEEDEIINEIDYLQKLK